MSMEDAGVEQREQFEISVRFREMIRSRIARLEADAASDEAAAERLENPDHLRRQMRLVAAQRTEACRMRRFLEHSQIRALHPIRAV
jgi:hypothetical protein